MIASPPALIELVRLRTGPKRIMFLPGHWPVTATCEEAEEHAWRVLEMVREIRDEENREGFGRAGS